jgi:hypothetical protein
MTNTAQTDLGADLTSIRTTLVAARKAGDTPAGFERIQLAYSGLVAVRADLHGDHIAVRACLSTDESEGLRHRLLLVRDLLAAIEGSLTWESGDHGYACCVLGEVTKLLSHAVRALRRAGA